MLAQWLQVEVRLSCSLLAVVYTIANCAASANTNLSQEHSAQVPTFDPRKSTAGLQGSDGRELPWDAFIGSAFPNTFPLNGAAARESDIGSWDVDFVGDIDWIGLDGLF